ncbi:hypothetical protein L9F63_016453, partial [Diploptera punctata]
MQSPKDGKLLPETFTVDKRRFENKSNGHELLCFQNLFHDCDPVWRHLLRGCCLVIYRIHLNYLKFSLKSTIFREAYKQELPLKSTFTHRNLRRMQKHKKSDLKILIHRILLHTKRYSWEVPNQSVEAEHKRPEILIQDLKKILRFQIREKNNTQS